MLSAKTLINVRLRVALRYTVCLACTFIADVAFNFACGPEKDPYDYYISFYHYNQSPASNYRSFYFTMCTRLYDDQEPKDEAEINAGEWHKYLGARVKTAHIEKAMYHLDRRADSILLKQYSARNFKISDSLKRNTFLTRLNRPKNRDARDYYVFTKRAEALIDKDGVWDPKKRSNALIAAQGNLALSNAAHSTDAFLKLRWYYQAQRMFFYTGDFIRSNRVYDDHIAKYPSVSHVKGWALSLRAGGESRGGDVARAAYLFSRVFDTYPERRVQAYNDYQIIKARLTEVLKQTRTNHEKAVLYVMEGFNQPTIGLNNLQQVYRYDPRSAMMGMLLTREVNKLEEAYQSNKLNKSLGYYTGRYSSYFNNNESKTRESQFAAYVPKLQNFCTRLASENRCADPSLGNITLAYLDWIQNRSDAGLNTLSAVNDASLSSKLSDQKQLVKLLLLTQKINAFDTVNEAELLPSLKWLDKKVATDLKTIKPPPGDRFYDELGYRSLDYNKYASSSRDFYQRILTPMYLRRHDTTKAALAMLQGALRLHSDGSSDQMYEDEDHAISFLQHYLHSSNLAKLVAWRHNPPTDPYLNFMAGRLKKLSPELLTELLGTAYLREHNYAGALATFKTIRRNVVFIPEKYQSDDEIDMGNPFNDHLNSFPRKYYTQNKSVLHYKIVFARAMYWLQKKASANPKDAARCYYKMATALYNTCMEGNAWGLISYDWLDDHRDHPHRFYYFPDFIQAQTAARLYTKAIQLSDDREFKARCVFMLAKCKQQQEPYFKTNWREERKKATDIRHIRDNPYFAVLKNNYSHTAFFKQAVGECSYLKDFITGR